MAESESKSVLSSTGKAGEVSLKDQGNEFFKAGNYLKAVAVYTRAIKQDPNNHTLQVNLLLECQKLGLILKQLKSEGSLTVSLPLLPQAGICRFLAFLHLVKLTKALVDAEMAIKLNATWEKGYFRKGCVLEAMERYDEALAVFQVASKYNPQSTEVSKKIKRMTQLSKDKQRAQEVEKKKSNIDIAKHLSSLKTELSEKYSYEETRIDLFSFLVETMEAAVKSWHETSKVDPRVYFLLDKEKTDTEKFAPVVNIDKAFELPHTHSNCFSYMRQHAVESFGRAACLIAPKSIISYPQVWKGQGFRKWKHGQSDGFFVQLESPSLRKLWFVPSASEMGQTLCRDPEALDISVHEVFPRLFKEATTSS